MRARTVKIDLEFMAGVLFAQGNVINAEVTNGIPPGSKIVAASTSLDLDRLIIELTIEHESFGEVPPGEKAPDLYVEFTQKGQTAC